MYDCPAFSLRKYQSRRGHLKVNSNDNNITQKHFNKKAHNSNIHYEREPQLFWASPWVAPACLLAPPAPAQSSSAHPSEMGTSWTTGPTGPWRWRSRSRGRGWSSCRRRWSGLSFLRGVIFLISAVAAARAAAACEKGVLFTGKEEEEGAKIRKR